MVTEIIWDDARFVRGPPNIEPSRDEDEWISDENENEDVDEEKQCPIWFKSTCKDNIVELKERKGRDVDDRLDHLARAEQIAAQPPLKKRWGYYQDLLRQQNEVLARTPSFME